MSSRNRTPKQGAARPSPARAMAFEVLGLVERRRGEPASLLHQRRYGAVDAKDRDLATEIVMGVLRHRQSLDWTLAHHCRRPLDSLDPRLLTSLRIGLYQIVHLDRVPARAAVDESVRLARAFGPAPGAGLVNAVLRSVLRTPGRPTLPGRERGLDYLATTLSHPRWLAARYLERLGLDGAEARCRKQNAPPPTYLRVSRRLLLEPAREMLLSEGFDSEPLPAVPGCLRVVSGTLGGVKDSSLIRQGLAFPQDAGSQLIPFLLDLESGDRVLDVCAAPGGKATGACERVAPGHVVAIEKRVSRARLLKQTASRLGVGNLFPVAADGRRLPLRCRFSRILADVPCSSLGTLRRNPDVRWRVLEEDLGAFQELQLAILVSVAERLEAGGRLVYSTCSTEPEENEDVVEKFLSKRADFVLLDGAASLPEAARHMVTPEGALRTLPERDDMDGYFAVVLTRRESR